MAKQLAIRTNGSTGDSYLYIEDAIGQSYAIGSDGGTNVFTINMSTAAAVAPVEATAVFAIQPSTGDIVFQAAGTGTLTITVADTTFTTGDVNVTLGDVVISTGNLKLPNTSNAGDKGCIFSGGSRVISFPDDWNVYIGKGIGGVGTYPNPLSTAYNIAIGAEGTLNSMQGACTNNIAIGRQVLNDLIGDPTLVTPANSNIAIGSVSLSQLTNGSNNVALGVGSLTALLTGSNNICISGGGSYTGSESNNICIASTGVLGDNNIMRLGDTTPGSINATYVAGIYGVTPTGTLQVVTINSSSQFGSQAMSFVSSWIEVTGTSASMVIGTGYISSNAGLVTLTLPSTAALGSEIKVVGKGAGGWLIAQNAGQQISWNATTATTVGVTGSLASTDRYDSISLLCTTANTGWVVLSSKGNITVA